MSRLLRLALGATFAAALGSAAHAQSFALGANVGTPGLGVEAQARVIDLIVLRAAGDFAEFDRDETYGDIAYSGKLKLATVGAFVDVHPMGNGFLLTGGAFFGKRRGELDGQPVRNVRIGSATYSPAEVGRIDGDIKMSKAQPFVGLGYDSTFTRSSAVGVKAIIGAAFSDEPEVALRASGGSLSTNPIFLQNVRQEEASVRDDAKDFKVFPVAQVGLTYRF
ncbi:MAG: hypothetical protein BGN86_04105 [Caulobacterales bacterium 68-7]|nr:MAG: hypothetical protein BGN86_04105 [Caulobacterales bacterium 68-7]